MTREEASNILDDYDVNFDGHTAEEIAEAFKAAIKALEQEPCDVFDEYGNYKYPSDVELTEPNTATSMPCEDAVSRQAVLDAMSDTWKHICFVARRKKPTKGEEAVYSDMVGTVKNLPPATAEPCEDAISRQAAIDALGEKPLAWTEGEYELGLQNQWQSDVDALKNLPSAQPKTGHWIFDEILDMHYYCSECKSMGVDYWDFCPNCGAKMESEVQECQRL